MPHNPLNSVGFLVEPNLAVEGRQIRGDVSDRHQPAGVDQSGRAAPWQSYTGVLAAEFQVAGIVSIVSSDDCEGACTRKQYKNGGQRTELVSRHVSSGLETGERSYPRTNWGFGWPGYFRSPVLFRALTGAGQ
jgi:hypothetical protein